MKNYVTGILGGIVGGFIATLPWVLVYVYGGWLLSILAAVIAAGFYYGYKLCHGPIDKKTPIIITICSVLIVIVTTLVTIPLLSLDNLGYEATFTNLQVLYENGLLKEMTSDLVISIIFTFLGISGIVTKAKQDADATPRVEVR